MKLNFYYEFPTSGIAADTCHLLAAEKLFNDSKIMYPDIEFTKINSHGYTYENGIPTTKSNPGCKYSHFFVIIENPDNKKYFVLSYWDKLIDVKNQNGFCWDLENCVEIFASAGVHTDDIFYKPIDFNYTPISCLTIHKSGEDRAQELYKIKNKRIIPNKLHFRTGSYLFRKYLIENDNRFDIKTERLSPKDFIDELDQYLINIDINTVAEISGRTVDILALGSALIRPKLTIKFHNELIPDYHYAAVKCEDIHDYKKLADAYIDRFEDLKKDLEYVKFISENGRAWYEENASLDAHVNILKKLINYSKLS
jgi:hypothetical protein